MMNNNKILTVSYGTFSCTLEGFDDSFETMKAIAEYFRDLAADDRYFGAEPPQPDADLLAKIAEREMSRRVEAREQDGRIMLTAHEDSAASPGVSEPEPVAAPAAAAVQDAEPAQAPAAAATPFVAVPAEPPAAPDVPQTSWQGTYTPEPEPPVPAPAEPEAVPVQPFAVDTAAAAPVVSDVPAGAGDFFAAGIPDAPDAAAYEEDTVAGSAESVTQDAPQPDSISDRLARIRAVVSRQVEVAAPADAYEEEEPVSAGEAPHGFDEMDTPPHEAFEDESTGVADTDPLAGAALDIESALEADDALIADAPDAPDELSEVLSRIEEDGEAESDEPVAENTDPADDDGAAGFLAEEEDDFDNSVFAADPAPSEAADEDVRAYHAEEPVCSFAEDAGDDAEDTSEDIMDAGPAESSDISDIDDAIAPEPEEDVVLTDEHMAVSEETDGSTDDFVSADMAQDEEPAPDMARSFDDDLPATEDTSEAEEGTAETTMGRVMKVSTDELEEALESGELEEIDVPESDDAAADEATGHAGAPYSARADLPDLSGVDGDDVNRLMAEADQQMEEPEGATRRSAFAHLRAAVAARFADKTMDTEAEAEETVEAYRSDLAEVVRPRRPVGGGGATDRPADQRAAPLKLVAEQRVDTASDADRSPIAPRRIAAGSDDEGLLTDDDAGFAAFASEMGATTLPELLEAAASYMSFVEGQEDFSRPQLMTRVRQASEGSEFTREDGLRSFGQLLRSGKIEKMKGGRFAASEDIGYRPDQRAAG